MCHFKINVHVFFQFYLYIYIFEKGKTLLAYCNQPNNPENYGTIDTMYIINDNTI